MENKRYILLQDLEVYKLARQLSSIGWDVYGEFDWQTKKIIGDQFIRSIDSVGANIAEGYSRFHYLDKVKFCYNARGSLAEAIDHWLELLKERNFISNDKYIALQNIGREQSIKLQNYISSLYRAKNSEKQQ